MTSILLDTNLLVYAHDPGDINKQQQAIRILNQIYLHRNGYISVQSLSEFINAVIRPKQGNPPRLYLDEAIEQVKYFANSFPIFDLIPEIILEAGRGVRDYHLAYYDAQIWATARLNQVPIVFSEDFQDLLTLETVTFINPFSAEFNIEDWA
jgi:predicted nucleic acid-binding protein